MAHDYYSTLGISKTATPEEIKRAYRKLAHQYHPDKGDKGDSEKFKQVSEAYQVLSDPEKRRQYDQFGSTFGQRGFAGGGPAGGFDFTDFASGFGFGGGAEFEDAFDIFSDIFGGGRRSSRREKGIDLEMSLKLSFKEAVFGTEKEITLEKKDVCANCSGTGAAPGAKINTCSKCHGQGQIRTSRRTIFGTLSSVATCDACMGTGKVPEKLCKECNGEGSMRRSKTLKVKIPAGVEDGQRLRIAGEGEVGYKGANFGDLFIRLSVADDPKFKREGNTVFTEIPISFYQAALGTEVEAETVDGTVKLKIPAGTQSGKVFRLKGKGVPDISGSGRGDHLVTVTVVTPSRLTKKEKELFKKLAEERGETVDVDESLWSRFTS